MNRYTIFCTEKQTRKALELGAPIVHHMNAYVSNSTPHFYIGEYGNFQKGFILYIIPTTEQMISWLEEQEGIEDILVAKSITTWYYNICPAITKSLRGSKFNSRKEATLAAIDAALEYLENLKQ